MSHQSGIKSTPNLISAFKDATAATRAIKVSIATVNGAESLVPSNIINAEGSYEDDFALIEPLYADKEPCFVIYRLDSLLSTGDFGWLLIQYVPDHAKIREKMLYASTRAALTKELGDMKFSDHLFGTNKEEVTFAGYKRHLAHQAADAPLTEKEIEYQKVKLTETGADIGASTRQTLATGVGLPVSDSAQTALRQWKSGEVSAVVLTIDSAKESIELQAAANVDVSGLSKLATPGEPSYIFFTYNNVFDGQEENKDVFFYICPSSSKVKSRMMFASSRAGILQFVEQISGTAVANRIELDSIEEVTHDYLTNYLHPKQELAGVASGTSSPAAFKRPPRPGKR